MLTNMVNNSIQAIDEKLKDSEISGQIELKADIVDNSYYISITDNGKGISSTDLELLKN
jgi:signal transduction histidine kinase